jgi:hypothetical protein
VATSSIDGEFHVFYLHETLSDVEPSGQVIVQSLFTPESYAFSMKRPLCTVAMEPNFSKSSGKGIVCGGLAGKLSLHEKGWLGHKETILHSGEGPIWQVRWKSRLIAWANDLVSICHEVDSKGSNLTSLFSGCENIRYCIADPYHLHRSSGK